LPDAEGFMRLGEIAGGMGEVAVALDKLRIGLGF
jgi:hypothetical protein